MQILVILIHISETRSANTSVETTNMYIASGVSVVSERVEYLIECKVPRK